MTKHFTFELSKKIPEYENYEVFRNGTVVNTNTNKYIVPKKNNCSWMHTKEVRNKMSMSKRLFTIDEASDIVEMKYSLNLYNKQVANIIGCSVTAIDKLIRGELKCRVA